MIEQRRLTKEEFERLIEESPETEKRNFLEFLDDELSPYDYFDKFAIEQSGVIADGRPLYVAALIPNFEGKKEFWTVANSNIKNYFSLCKIAKHTLKDWVEKHGDIYATMEKVSERNMAWTEWLGFQMSMDSDNVITYVIKRSKVNA